MNANLLETKMSESGLKYKFIAEKLGISEQGLTQKRKGNIPFKVSEIKILQKMLGLTDKERDRIFL